MLPLLLGEDTLVIDAQDLKEEEAGDEKKMRGLFGSTFVLLVASLRSRSRIFKHSSSDWWSRSFAASSGRSSRNAIMARFNVVFGISARLPMGTFVNGDIAPPRENHSSIAAPVPNSTG